jgi:hypothetical protein
MAKTITKQKSKELRHTLYVCIAGNIDTLKETQNSVTVYELKVTNKEETELRAVNSIYCFSERPHFFYGESVLEVKNIKQFKDTVN